MQKNLFAGAGISAATALCICLALLAAAAFARDGAGGALAPKDPVCGFTKNFQYLEENSNRPGLEVRFVSPAAARVGEPATLRFLVCRQPGDFAVDNLQLEHEKFVHIIGVRDDLNDFFHIHPVKVAPGVWEVAHTFTNGGSYKIWSDVRLLDVSYAIGHPVLKVTGSRAQPNAHAEDRPDYVVRVGHQITFKHTQPLFAGNTVSLQFLVRDASGREVETENFLGAPMHLVIVKEDLSIYLHAHPDHQDTLQPAITFSQVFPKEGRYKLFAQFRPKGTSLPPDDAILAEFYVTVGNGTNTSAGLDPKTP